MDEDCALAEDLGKDTLIVLLACFSIYFPYVSNKVIKLL